MRKLSRFRLYLVLVALFVLSSLGWTQNASPSDAETIPLLVQQVKELQKHDRELEDRIKLLEANQKAASTPEPAASVPVASTTGASAPAEATAPSAASPQELPEGLHDLHGIQWKGFAEVNYKVLNQRQPELGTYGFIPGSAGNFYTGDFDLFLTSKLTARTSILSEMVFEETDAQNYKIDLRRVLLKCDWNDHLKMSFGRYQTSIGYYNQEFLSAAWLQTTADRPLVMEYASDGGLLPTQAVGVSLTGSIPSAKLGLHYLAEYGTSDTVRPDINGTGQLNDENDGNHVLLGLFVRPDKVPGLQIGSSFFQDKISDLSNPADVERYKQTIINAYVVYNGHGLELLNEGFLIRHDALREPDLFNMPAFYSQVSQRIGRLRPFVRYQYTNANPGSVFDDISLRYGPSFGARYDFNEYIAFKAQLDHTARKGLPDLNGLHLQLSGTF